MLLTMVARDVSCTTQLAEDHIQHCTSGGSLAEAEVETSSASWEGRANCQNGFAEAVKGPTGRGGFLSWFSSMTEQESKPGTSCAHVACKRTYARRWPCARRKMDRI